MRLTQENIDWLIRNAKLKSLYDNTYIQDSGNENYKYIKQRFFRHESNDTVNVLNVGTGLFSPVVDTPANYTGNPISDDEINITKCTADYKIYNYCTLGLIMETVDGKPVAKTTYLPAEGWFYQDGFNHIARVYRKSEILGQVDYYILIQRFEDNFTENKLYKMPTGFSIGKSVALDFDNLVAVELTELDQTKEMVETMPHPFGRPAIFVIKEDAHVLYPVGSVVEQVKQQIYAMDRKKVMFDNQFLQNVESFILFKGIDLPPMAAAKYEQGQRIDYADLGKVIEAAPEGSIEFINNTNALIKDAMESTNKDLKQLSAISKVPLDFLGAEVMHGAIGKGSRSLLHGAFTKDIESIRNLWDEYLPNVFNSLSGINGTETSYTWPDIFGSSDLEVAEEMTIALNAGIISQERAIQTYLGLDDEEAKEEILKINLNPNSIDGGEDNRSDTVNQEEGEASETI